MLKATKLTFAAMLLAGSYGLAIAQDADSGGVSTDKPANRDTLETSKKQSKELQQGAPRVSGAAQQQQMQQKNTGMTTNAGPNETGTAKDTAGSATQRDPAKQKQ
jgi:hypothetical protein